MAKKNDKPLPLRTFDLIKENLLRQDLFVPIFAVGSAIRIFFVLEADFPLNDGGLFYKMTQELVENNFRLPLFTSYNHASIPFAYPPLGFYVAGILTKLFNISLINIFRFLPLAVSILTIYAFYILVKELFPLKTALLSTFIFVLLPRSFMWQIMGGGVARSLGLFFSLLTLINAAAYFKSRSNKHLYLGITFMTLTTLSHLEWLFFTLYSLVIINAHIKRGLKSFKNILLIIFVTTLLTFPWWFTITKRFGFTPFSNFLRAGSVYKDFATYPHLMTLSFTDEPFLSILGTLGLMGLFISVFRGNLFLLAWFITPLLLAPRSSPNLTVIPLSVAASITINQFFLLLRNGKFGDSRNLEGEKSKNKIYGSISRILILFLNHNCKQWIGSQKIQVLQINFY
jgi:hypothetical protein